jgi:hypothetical protein
MAIDMIEDNELGALSLSRTRSGFLDDEQYAKFLGTRLNWDIAGIKTTQRRTNEIVGDKRREYAVDQNRKNDCDYLMQRIQEIKNQIQYELSKNPDRVGRERYVDPLSSAETQFKNLILSNKCEEKKAKAEEDRLKKETEEAISRAAADTPKIPEIKVAQGSPVTKIILIGVGVLVVAVVGVALFRKRN